MEVGERVKKVLAGGLPDRVPWLIYSNHLPRGSFERRMRDMGLGLDVRCSVYKASMPNVRIEERTQGDHIFATYHTPEGDVSTKTRTRLKFQFPGGSWVIEHPVKEVGDIKVLEFMVKDTVYEPDYDNCRQLKGDLGDDGIITVGSDYTPLMKTIIRYMGFRTFAIMLRRNPEDIRNFTVSLLEDIAPGKGFIISITEDIHPDHFRKGISVITETLHKHGVLPIRPPLPR